MAKAKPRKSRNGQIAEFPSPKDDSQGPDTAVAVEDPAESEPDPPEPPLAAEPQAPPPPRTGRPDPLPKIRSFFDTLSSIPAADWGTRAKVRVYRLKPIYDMLLGSTKKYIRIYDEPPVNEETIKHDEGSGRYRLYLNFKTAGDRKDKEIDSVEFDIMDPRYPPNLPVGPWLDDPANREWKWARPILEAREAKIQQEHNPPPAAPGANMMDAMDMLDRIQDRAEERMKERADRPQVAWDPAQQLQTVANVAKEMASALKATPDNPIPAFISDQMAAMRTELADARRRSDTLMDKLLDMARAPQQQQNNGMSAIKELVTGVKDLLPSLKELWPNADEAIAERVTRSKMGPWQEFFAPVLPRLVDALAPIMPGILMTMSGNNRPPGPPQQFAPGLPAPTRPNPSAGMMPPPPQPQPQAQHSPNLDEMLLNALTNDRDGGEFADSLVMLFGQQGQLMYRQAASLGEQGLLTLIQQWPIWNQLGPLQSKVAQFVHEFIEYGQEEPAEETPEGTEPAAADDKVVDLTGETA